MLIGPSCRFWNDLIANKSAAGMFMYEQDWLSTEFDRSKSLGESVLPLRAQVLGGSWGTTMRGAARNKER